MYSAVDSSRAQQPLSVLHDIAKGQASVHDHLRRGLGVPDGQGVTCKAAYERKG